MSSGTFERPISGTIEEISFGEIGVDVTSYLADSDGAPVVEVEATNATFSDIVRVYVNGVVISVAVTKTTTP